MLLSYWSWSCLPVGGTMAGWGIPVGCMPDGPSISEWGNLEEEDRHESLVRSEKCESGGGQRGRRAWKREQTYLVSTALESIKAFWVDQALPPALWLMFTLRAELKMSDFFLWIQQWCKNVPPLEGVLALPTKRLADQKKTPSHLDVLCGVKKIHFPLHPYQFKS